MTHQTSTEPDRRARTREIDELLIHLRGLALVREILAARGVATAALEAHSREVERRRRQLAELVRGRVGDAPAPALGEAA